MVFISSGLLGEGFFGAFANGWNLNCVMRDAINFLDCTKRQSAIVIAGHRRSDSLRSGGCDSGSRAVIGGECAITYEQRHYSCSTKPQHPRPIIRIDQVMSLNPKRPQ